MAKEPDFISHWHQLSRIARRRRLNSTIQSKKRCERGPCPKPSGPALNTRKAGSRVPTGCTFARSGASMRSISARRPSAPGSSCLVVVRRSRRCLLRSSIRSHFFWCRDRDGYCVRRSALLSERRQVELRLRDFAWRLRALFGVPASVAYREWHPARNHTLEKVRYWPCRSSDASTSGSLRHRPSMRSTPP